MTQDWNQGGAYICVSNDDEPDKLTGAPHNCGVGNPCDAATGNKYEVETDYASGDDSLRFTRHYNSNRYGGNTAAIPNHTNTVQIDRFGFWHPGASRFVQTNTSGSFTTAMVARPDGRVFYFNLVGGFWQPDADIHAQLAQTAGGWTYSESDGRTETYDTQGRLIAESDPSGRATSYTSSSEKLASITGPHGHSLTLGYDSAGRLATLTDPTGGITTYRYNDTTVASNGLTSPGTLKQVTYPDNTAKLYHYEDTRFPNHLTGISYATANPDGSLSNVTRYSTYAYDANGKATRTEHAQTDNGSPQERFLLIYDSATQTTVTDPVNMQEVMTFSTNLGVKNLTAKVNQSDSKAVAQVFDPNNNLTCRKDEENRVTTYIYNTTNQRTGMTEGLTGDCANPATVAGVTRTITYEYLSPTLDLPRFIRRPSVATGQTFETEMIYGDAAHPNLPTQIIQRGFTPSGSSVSRTVSLGYNPAGQVISINGPRTDVSDITTLEYYDCTTGGACGQLMRITSALGHVTTYGLYDPNGRLTQMTDPNGLVTSYVYDPRGRVRFITQTPPIGTARVTEYRYTPWGDVSQALLPGMTLTYFYDAAHDLKKITDNLGNEIRYRYDLKGNRTQEYTYDPAGVLVRQVDLAYDLRNHPASILLPGSLTQLIHDAVGNLLNEFDPNGNPATQHSPDALNRLIQTLDRLGGTTTYGYDINNRLKQVTAPNNAITTYVYDDLGNLLQETGLDRGSRFYTYDTAGNLKTLTDARGILTSYSYDALNRVTLVDYPGTAEDVSLTYDSGPNCTLGIGRLCRVVDESGTTEYSYDAFGNVLAERHTELGVTALTAYTFDAADRVLSITYPGGRAVTYTRDVLGRITNVTATLNGTPQTIVSNRTHRPDGLLLTQTYGNGLNEVRQYDLQGRLTSQSLGSADTRTYTYDDNGNLTRKQSLTDTADYGHDALDRLMGEFYDTPGPFTDFLIRGYDGNGNVRGEGYGVLNDGQPFTGEEYSDGLYYDYAPGSNRLAAAGHWECCYVTYDHDASGNLTRLGVDLVYNAANRLARLTYAGSDYATYKYDYRGLRTRKVSGLGTVRFHYDQEGRLLAETTASGAVLKAYVWADDLPLAQIENEQVTYLHPDHLNTPRLATNAAQTVTWRLERMIFGSLFPQEDPDQNGVLTFVELRGPGQYHDRETGFFYNGQRYLWEAMGRYITSDPIGLSGGLNTYVAVANNPLRYTDRTGNAIDAPVDVGFILYDLYRIGKDNIFGSKGNFGENCAALGADVGGLFVPGATGLGLGVRAAKSTKATKALRNELPSLDRTGKVHGALPRAEDLSRYSRDELRQLQRELQQSVQQRIRRTSELGPDKAHGQRQAAEQQLIIQIEKHLSGS